MTDNHKHPFRTTVTALLMPEYFLAGHLDKKITGKDFCTLFAKNLLFFAVCTLIIVMAEIVIFHDFNSLELLPYALSDIFLALFFSFLQISWVKSRQKKRIQSNNTDKNNN